MNCLCAARPLINSTQLSNSICKCRCRVYKLCLYIPYHLLQIFNRFTRVYSLVAFLQGIAYTHTIICCRFSLADGRLYHRITVYRTDCTKRYLTGDHVYICVVKMASQVPPLSYFSFNPVLHNWCNPVCGMMHIKQPCIENRPCGGSGFPLSLSE